MSDHFEDAVERMLADVAIVNRSLVAEARGAIDALPDRRVGVASRVQRSVAHRLPSRARFALAGAATIVVAVAAASILTPLQSRPSGLNSTSPSVVMPSATASASPNASVTATPLPSAIRTGPAYGENLSVLLTGAHAAFSGWSPDGSRYAITIGDSSPVTHLFDRSGVEVGSVTGVVQNAFAWLDSNRYVFLFEGGNGPAAFLGRIGSGEVTQLGSYDTLVSGPAGSIALALRLYGDPSIARKHQYVVVSADGSLSKPLDGDPTAWSRDGSLLAVYHATQLAPAPSGDQPEALGSFEIVRSSGERVASTQKLTFANPYVIAFSPDLARMAFVYDAQPGTGTAQIAVLEIRTGHVTIIPESGQLTWASSDKLLFASTSTPSAIMAWSAGTGRVTTYGTGNVVGASGLGTVVVGSEMTGAFTWTTTSGGSTRTGTFSLGENQVRGFWIPDNSWSPDGSSLILTVGDWNSGSPMDAVLFRP
jgi:hypothetical protein